MANKQMQTIGVVVAVVIVLALAGIYLSSSGSKTSGNLNTTTISQSQPSTTQSYSNSGGTYPILLTDPQHVPRGTQALLISYSSVQVHTLGSTEWVSAQGSGSLNLTALQNGAQVIALANLSSNADVNMVRFSITSAQIIINGTTYAVQAPSGQVTTSVFANTSSSGTVVQITPSVIALYSEANGTSFVLTPSLKAIVASNVSTSTGLGVMVGLSTGAKTQLAAASPQLQVAGAQISYLNTTGATTIYITLRNNGNKPAILQNVFVYGNQSVTVATTGPGIIGLGLPGLTQSNITIMGGAPVAFTVTSQTNATIASLVNTGIQADKYGVLPFQILGLGNMQFINSLIDIGGSAEVLPGQSATLSYSGQMISGNGRLFFKPISGQTYTIVIQGMNGTEITTTAVASTQQ